MYLRIYHSPFWAHSNKGHKLCRWLFHNKKIALILEQKNMQDRWDLYAQFHDWFADLDI